MRSISSVLFLCLFALSACSKEASDQGDWIGKYVYEADSGETVGGDKAIVTYKLTLATDKCLLEAQGYQTDEAIICEQVTDGKKVAVNFVSYDGGSKTNVYGVEVYHPHEMLFALERREKIIETEWRALKPIEDANSTCRCFTKTSK